MAELIPLSVSEAAERLSVSLPELVRWCVQAQRVPPRWRFDAAALPALAREAGWVRALPDDAPVACQERLPLALQVLRERGHHDGDALRADTLWRGLPAPEAAAFERAIERLLTAGWLLRAPGDGPLHISIPREAEARLQRLDDPSVTLDDLLPSP